MQQIQLPQRLHVLKYKTGTYLGSSSCDFKPRSTVFGFVKGEDAKIIRKHIIETNVYNVYYHPKRPYEYLLKPYNSNALRPKPVDYKELSTASYESEYLLQYIGTNNVDLTIIEDVQSVKNNHLRMFVSYIFQPELGMDDLRHVYEDSYSEGDNPDLIL